MTLDYYTLLCPEPISLSIGTIKHPFLRDIGKLGYKRFMMYQVYLKLTPREYYTKLNTEHGEQYWDVLTDGEKEEISLFDVIIFEKSLQNIYTDILNFFFIERVVYNEGMFILINTDDYDTPFSEMEISDEMISGVITNETLEIILDIFQQLCCIKSKDPLDDPKPVFKNEKARRMYEKIQKANEQKTQRKVKEEYYNLLLPNIISSVATKCPGLNIVNIWDSTLFQLYDQFDKTRNDDTHYMNCVRVAVWGDEKNQFDPTLWYKNNFDKHE